MDTLVVENLNKSYGKNHILKNINFSLAEGGFLILVGPSGCGKSTLLNSIAGLDAIDNGRIIINNKDVAFAPPNERDIAMVFQSYALYPNMTVAENISFGLKIRKVPKADIKEKIKSVAKILQLEELLNRKPAQLSGGQRQRVAMGRAIARDPVMYLFDEPLSNLDAKLRVEMRLEIKKLHRNVGRSIVYVTHDQVEAMTLGDRIAVMDRGNIVQLDSPSVVYNHPNSTYVASFIGSPGMNIMPTMVDARDGKPALIFKIGSKVFEHIIDTKHKNLIGKEIQVGIRPQDVSDTKSHDHCLAITCPVDFQETTGADLFTYTKVNSTEFIARCRPDNYLELDSNIDLFIDVDRLHLFDSQTSLRIT